MYAKLRPQVGKFVVGYELVVTWVRVGIGYEMTWVGLGIGYELAWYDLTWVRIDWHPFVYIVIRFVACCRLAMC